MSYSVLRNGGRHWRFVLRSAIQQEVRVKRKPFKHFRHNRKSIPRRSLTSIRKNDNKKSRLISFLALNSVQRSNLTAALFTVPFAGSMQEDTSLPIHYDIIISRKEGTPTPLDPPLIW